MSSVLHEPMPRRWAPMRGPIKPWSVLGNLAVASVLAWIAWLVLRWSIVAAVPPWADPAACRDAAGACWPFLAQKFRLILFGRYPYVEQWRAALFLAIAVAAIVWTLLRTLRDSPAGIGGRSILAVWVVTLTVSALLMLGGVAGLPYVSPENWDGLPLTLMLATAGSFGGFWLSIPLALARRSQMPVVRASATAYIEVVRGVPLVGFLFMAFVLAPLLLPKDWTPNSPTKVIFVLVLFKAAYMAEALRGAMQGIPKGHYEAAAALGLGYWKTVTKVLLPQALRQALPSLANIFIMTIKDTAIVFTVGMFDLMGAAESAVHDPLWRGRFLEVYVFVAAIYMALCGGVSMYGRALERRGVRT